MKERQITTGPGGRILTNINVWSADSRWIVYDTRPDVAGSDFRGTDIGIIQVQTGETRRLYQSQHGASCGVATWHPTEPRVAFILGPEHPTPDWSYGPSHRQGVIIDVNEPGSIVPLDARDLTAPGTPGALRGGTHVHVWHPRGDWISFTYDDALVDSPRTIGVAIPGTVTVPMTHPRNHAGTHQACLVTTAGSHGLLRACEEGWIGHRRALAFQGTIAHPHGGIFIELFVAELPDSLGPMLPTQREELPKPPAGIVCRRRTYTNQRRYPGLSGPRHWIRSSPCGEWLACLMADDRGIPQLWIVPTSEGTPRQCTDWPNGVATAFTWHPDGEHLAIGDSTMVYAVHAFTGRFRSLSAPVGVRPEAVVIAPDGQSVAFVRTVQGSNQIVVADWQKA
jgi:hypothetical protein